MLSSGAWQTLREYLLGYGLHTKPGRCCHGGHSRLDTLKQYGKGGYAGTDANLLHTYSFTYIPDYNSMNHVRLYRADNGWGGSVDYQWQWYEFGGADCSGCSTMPDHFRVLREFRYDGQGLTARIDHEYATPRANMVDNNRRYEFLGHAFHRSIVYTSNTHLGISDRVEQRIESWYHQRDTSGGVDPRRGRTYQEDVRNSAGTALMQRHLITWVTTAQSNTNWVYKGDDIVRTYDGDGNDNDAYDRTHYVYEASYGNLIRSEQYNAAGVLLRYTTIDYDLSSTLVPKHIVNRPKLTKVFADGGCRSEQRLVYDAWGRVTQTEQPLTICDETNSANLIVGHRAYDANYDVVVREWTDGTSHDVRTIYDTSFHLFPVRRYNNAATQLDERVRYYGVLYDYNGDGNANNDGVLTLADSRAYGGRSRSSAPPTASVPVRAMTALGAPSIAGNG